MAEPSNEMENNCQTIMREKNERKNDGKRIYGRSRRKEIIKRVTIRKKQQYKRSVLTTLQKSGV